MGNQLNDDFNPFNYDAGKFSFDANIIIDFFYNNYEKILEEIFLNKIYLSSLILTELKAYNLKTLNFKEVEITTSEGSEYFYLIGRKFHGLSVQDKHLITICKFNNYYCVTNDNLVRNVCAKEGIKKIGTLVILDEAIRINLIKAIDAVTILDEMISNGMYLSKKLYNNFISKLKLH